MNQRTRYTRIQRIFLEACEQPVAKRAAFLDQACADNDDLRQEVERLLEHDISPHQFIDSPESGKAIHQLAGDLYHNEHSDGLLPAMPEQIGPYRIIRVIGHGGMGVIYEAQQNEPRRRVALKVLRPGCLSSATLGRFRSEAQALGHLHHPGIARIFHAGTAEADGQPFLVMELLEGPTLLDYASQHNLDLNRRLEIIADICDALHHAHQRGIIHRDLKPGNILVDISEPSSIHLKEQNRAADVPSNAQPKILDFGIARITDESVRTVTLQTTAGELMGTVAYMSPEQVSGDPQDVDIRSDVYAMGVIMFELLAHQLPIDVRDRAVHVAIRAIQEKEPTRLRSLDRKIPDDIDTIAAKALEKDPTRRYQSAAEFAIDIRRYLADEPILARPPSSLYQFRKFARRNRAIVTGVSIAAAALFLAAITSTILAVYAVRSEQAQSEARADAERARDQAQAVNDFLAEMLGAADPDQMGKDVRIVDVLERASAEIDEQFPHQPAIRSRLHRNIGMSYRRLGMLEEAEIQLLAAVEDARAAFDHDHPILLRTLNSLAVLYDNRGEYDRSVPMYKEILRIQARTLGPTARDTLGTACNLGLTLYDLERYDEAADMLQPTLATMRETLGPADRYTINCLQGLGTVRLRQNRLEDATAAFTEARDVATGAFGRTDLRTISAITSLAEVSLENDSPQQALQTLDDALDRAQAVLPLEHWKIGLIQRLRGIALTRLKRFDQAEESLQQAHAVYREIYGVSDIDTQEVAGLLVYLYQTWQKTELAEEWRTRSGEFPEEG